MSAPVGTGQPADSRPQNGVVTAQRVVYANERLTKFKSVEPLNDPKFYQEFFNRLSKSVFLQEQKT